MKDHSNNFVSSLKHISILLCCKKFPFSKIVAMSFLVCAILPADPL